MIERKIVVGDIGATQLRLALARGHDLSEIVKHPTPESGRNFWNELVEVITGYAEGRRAEALKIAIAGAVSTGSVASPLIRGSFPLGPILRERLGLPVTVANDLQAVALGELSAGAARGEREALVVTVSTGLNAAVIARGAVLPAPARIADEYGHRPLPIGLLPDARTDPACGRTCFHANASGLSVYRRARAAGLEFAENRDFDRLAEAGDARALELYEQEGRLLAEWLGGILKERTTPLVVWQGTFARRGFSYFEWALRDGLSQLVGKVPEFRHGELGDNAGLIGASYLR